MKKLDPAHPHLVGMLGYCTAGEHVAMVTEFMPHGNLRDFLVKHRKLTEVGIMCGPPVIMLINGSVGSVRS